MSEGPGSTRRPPATPDPRGEPSGARASTDTRDASHGATSTGAPPDGPERAAGSFTIVNERGLHARAATKLVQLAARFPCEVTLVGREGQQANGKSVMGVLLLCGSKGTQLEVHAEGQRASEAVDALGELIRERFGETE
jgi:phosphocarrier protein HPr